MKHSVDIDEENLSPAINSDDDEQLNIQKRRRLENLEKARQTKKAKLSSEPPRGKTSSARILADSRALRTRGVDNRQDTQGSDGQLSSSKLSYSRWWNPR